jgi:hypothetical protein
VKLTSTRCHRSYVHVHKSVQLVHWPANQDSCRHKERGPSRSVSEAKCGVLDLVCELHGNAGTFSVLTSKLRCASSEIEKPDKRRVRMEESEG